MKIGQESWGQRIAEGYKALRTEQQSILTEVRQLRNDCHDPAQLARLERLEARATEYLASLGRR